MKALFASTLALIAIAAPLHAANFKFKVTSSKIQGGVPAGVPNLRKNQVVTWNVSNSEVKRGKATLIKGLFPGFYQPVFGSSGMGFDSWSFKGPLKKPTSVEIKAERTTPTGKRMVVNYKLVRQ